MRRAETSSGISRERGGYSPERDRCGSGEPDAWKLACPVRRGADGKGRMTYLASRLPDNMHPLAFGARIAFPARITYQRAGPVRVSGSGINKRARCRAARPL